LLEKQECNQDSQEQRDLFDWKRKQLDGFLAISDNLPPETKEEIQQRMAELAQNFLKDNF
jgi:ABC-type phosphate/phosphonate transport system substrate-binding protein